MSSWSGCAAPVTSGDEDGPALVSLNDESEEGWAEDPVADAKGMPLSFRKIGPAILLKK